MSTTTCCMESMMLKLLLPPKTLQHTESRQTDSTDLLINPKPISTALQLTSMVTNGVQAQSPGCTAAAAATRFKAPHMCMEPGHVMHDAHMDTS